MAKKTRPPLSKRREKYADDRGEGLLVGKPIRYNASAMAAYADDLKKIVGEMNASTEYWVRASMNAISTSGDLLTQDAEPESLGDRLSRLKAEWIAYFTERASPIVARMFGRVDASTTKAMSESLSQIAGKQVGVERSITLKDISAGMTLSSPALTAGQKAALEIGVQNNVELIKSIPEEYFKKIEGSVHRSLLPGGRGMADVYDDLIKLNQSTKKRAELIARDQVRKATSQLQAYKAVEKGFTQFRWQHSGGGVEPRRLHLDLDGQIFNYSDLPIIDKRTGERGLPGQLINCKCVAVPVVEWGF